MNRLFEWFIYMVNEWFIWMVSFYMVIEWFIHIIYLDMFICMVIDGLMVYRIDWIWYVELTCHSIVNIWFISVVTKWFIASVDICRSSMDYHKWTGTRDTKVQFLFLFIISLLFHGSRGTPNDPLTKTKTIYQLKSSPLVPQCPT